jgi:hypothetical protein
MAKEKVELVFLGGGAMLSALTNRLRRSPATPREDVGAAMHDLGRLFEARRGGLVQASPAEVAEELAAVSCELCAAAPRRVIVEKYLDAVAALVAEDDELAGAVERVRVAVAGWLD